MCRIRAFENEVYQAIEDGRVAGHAYLCAGEETPPAVISEMIPDAAVFIQHRGHGAYIAYGGNLEALRDELLGIPTGCSKGIAGSTGIQDQSKKIIGHNALIGDQVPIATGWAYAKREPVVCFFGDGALEEDYVLPCFGFAAKHKLPILFICVDNDMSVLTTKEERRDWDGVDVAHAYGLNTAWCKDIPAFIEDELLHLPDNEPAFINIDVCRHYWHVGAGIDSEPKWDTMQETYDNYKLEGVDVDGIRQAAEEEMRILWERQ
jgi:pyruvate dehydrogenase E1 component alpha subunit